MGKLFSQVLLKHVNKYNKDEVFISQIYFLQKYIKLNLNI